MLHLHRLPNRLLYESNPQPTPHTPHHPLPEIPHPAHRKRIPRQQTYGLVLRGRTDQYPASGDVGFWIYGLGGAGGGGRSGGGGGIGAGGGSSGVARKCRTCEIEEKGYLV